MAEKLLTSERFIKETTSISDNVDGKFLLSAMREAQDIGLRRILGDSLLAKLKSCVKNGGFEGEEKYQMLLDNCQYYLAYTSVVGLVMRVSYKVANAGVTKTSDENVQNASYSEIVANKAYYQTKADMCAYDLQKYLLAHRGEFPELKDCDCQRISAHLKDSATCGINLGGARGKIIRRGRS